MLGLLSSNAQECKNYVNCPNHVMWIFIGKLALSTIRWVPMCHILRHFSGVLHHFVLAKLATSSVRVRLKRVKCHIEAAAEEFSGPWRQLRVNHSSTSRWGKERERIIQFVSSPCSNQSWIRRKRKSAQGQLGGSWYLAQGAGYCP